MSEPRPVIVHPATPDMERWQLFSRDGWWAGWIRNDAGDVSGWHHHAGNDTYVYVIRGSITVDFGPGGAESAVAHAGDSFVVPAQVVHRETTSPDADLEAVVVRRGGEPEQVDVDGPEL